MYVLGKGCALGKGCDLGKGCALGKQCALGRGSPRSTVCWQLRHRPGGSRLLLLWTISLMTQLWRWRAARERSHNLRGRGGKGGIARCPVDPHSQPGTLGRRVQAAPPESDPPLRSCGPRTQLPIAGAQYNRWCLCLGLIFCPFLCASGMIACEGQPWVLPETLILRATHFLALRTGHSLAPL